MRTNDKRIIKTFCAFETSTECCVDEIWVIPLQKDTTIVPDVSDNGQINNHGYPYIRILHADDELPIVPGKKNPWEVTILQETEEGQEILGQGTFKSAREALNSRLVTTALSQYEKEGNLYLC